MVSPVILSKQHPDVPDFYQITISFITGGEETFDVANHFPIKDGFFEFWTTDDRLHVVPVSSIKQMIFDKNYSKLVEIKHKMEKEKEHAS